MYGTEEVSGMSLEAGPTKRTTLYFTAVGSFNFASLDLNNRSELPSSTTKRFKESPTATFVFLGGVDGVLSFRNISLQAFGQKASKTPT